MTPALIKIALTPAQIATVLSQVTQGGGLAPLLASLHGAPDAASVLSDLSSNTDYRISRSLVVGLLVFTALPPDGSAIRLRDIARSVGVPQSTTLRYVNTLIAVGLVERAASGLGYQAALVA